MGLFDRIKKSLFGNKDEEEKTSPENLQKETKENEEVEQNSTETEAQENLQEDKKPEEAQQETESEEENHESDVSDEVVQEQEITPAKEEKETEAENKESEETEEEPVEKSVEPEETQEDSEDADESTQVEITDEEQTSEESETDQDEDVEEKTEESEQDRYDKGLEKTNHTFGERLNAFFARFRSVDEDFFDDLEDLLIESDVGFETAQELTDSLQDEAKLQNAKSHDALKQVVVEKLVDIYEKGGEGKDSSLKYDENAHPNVYLFVGVNGAGKTTTIGKLAKRLKDSGKSVMMVAADTFRAGAVAQLVEWGKRSGVEVVTGPEKADPASVVFDGVTKAKENNVDYLLVDTAGRLQNKVNLMNELDKIKRTIQKIIPDQPEEILLVLDGSTGQNALLQAKDFDKTTKLTGLVLTKLDGSSKGGVVLAIRNEMDLPVKLVGLGEKVDDLADFDAEKFAIGLFQGLI